jgi:methylmalonyl-CoA mutase C-terminal domain/subunit
MAVVATALRDAGMEVIYGGMLSAEQIVTAAIQENVDIIGLSLGGRLQQVRQVMDLLQQEKIENLIVIAGGTIPREDIPLLKEMGISEVFPPGSSLESIVKYIEDCVV